MVDACAMFLRFSVALVVLAGCASSPQPPLPLLPQPSAVPEDRVVVTPSPTPPVSTTAEAVTRQQEAPSPAFQSELEALKRCPPYDGVGGRCQAFWAFTAERRDAMTLAEEETLLTLLGDQHLRFAAALRMAHQPGPRNSEPARALVLVQRSLDVRDFDDALDKWLGRAVGAVTLESEEVRQAVSALVRDHSNEKFAAAVIEGIGVAHPNQSVALDMVDAALQDPRAPVRFGVLQAYAETAMRDPPRACATWARALKDETDANAVRAAALLSGTPECRPQHPLVLEAAQARLAQDPNSAMDTALPGLCSTPGLAKRVLPLATSLLDKGDTSRWYGALLEAIGRCDPRGAAVALRPWIRRGGRLGQEAQHVLKDIQRRRP